MKGGWKVPQRPLPAHERVLRRTDQTGECWLFTGYRNPKGYGMTGDGAAHRVVYEALVGPIPEGHDVHHTCGQPSCVNPAHLTIEDHDAHVRHHKNGGEVCVKCGGSDWISRADGRRRCRACDNARRRASWAATR